MNLLSKVLVLLIALEHVFILWIEMFLWTSKGKKFFPHMDQSFLELTKGMAANQGLYNGFLAAGLVWATLIRETVWAYQIAYFFLGCVIVAGLYGAVTASKGIFFKQALPAILVLTAIFFF